MSPGRARLRLRLVVLGPPGVGKSTYAACLGRQWDIPHVGAGDLVRAGVAARTASRQIVGSSSRRGSLVPDAHMIQRMR